MASSWALARLRSAQCLSAAYSTDAVLPTPGSPLPTVPCSDRTGQPQFARRVPNAPRPGPATLRTLWLSMRAHSQMKARVRTGLLWLADPNRRLNDLKLGELVHDAGGRVVGPMSTSAALRATSRRW